MTVPIPPGIRVVPDLDTTARGVDRLVGGVPRRVIRLSVAGQAAWTELRRGPVQSCAAGILARRLTDAGLAHPQSIAQPGMIDVTVIIPVLDRTVMLERCLEALDGQHSVIVVDDGSSDALAVASIARRHHARLLRRSTNGGPAAARNLGLHNARSEFVAFLDSDCIPPVDWIERLAVHFADPLVGAVAPRIVAVAGANAYFAACGTLDLGDRAARVQPGGRITYVPTAALVVRRAALEAVARDGEVFDPTLRYGEDVDLVWRLDEAGWRIRYDPTIEVRHDEPAGWRDRQVRRFRYGTSAAPLARRHPGALAPLTLRPWPALAVAALLTRRPLLAAVGLAATTLTTRQALGRADLADLGAGRMTASSIVRTWRGLGRYATQFGSPLLLGAALARDEDDRPRHLMRRVAAVSLLVGPPLSTWLETRKPRSPLSFVVGQISDDVAYGAGVYVGCIQSGSVSPLLPVRVRPARSGREAR